MGRDLILICENLIIWIFFHLVSDLLKLNETNI